MNNKGITLVEIIVIAVMVITMAAVSIPLYMGAKNDQMHKSTPISPVQVRSIGNHHIEIKIDGLTIVDTLLK